METGLKNRTLKSAKWSVYEKAVNLIFEFLIGIVLARLLLPTDFGIVALVSSFVTFSLVFVNSGFNQSLIRSSEVKDFEYSSVFTFNIFVGLLVYLILFLLAPYISNYSQSKELVSYIRVSGLSVLIASLTFVQRVKYLRDLNFKTLSVFSVISSVVSGVFSLFMAFWGCGVWSLVFKTLIREAIESSLLWYRGYRNLHFCLKKKALNKHLKFGTNLLFTAIAVQVYNALASILIGRFFGLRNLGFYNRAQMFSNIISVNIVGIITSVSYPALARIQNDRDKFLSGVKLLIKQGFYLIGILMVGLFFASNQLVSLVLGDRWSSVGEILQFLCVSGFFWALSSILINALSIIGKSRLYFLFHLLILAINSLGLFFGYFYGFKTTLSIMAIGNGISYVYISFVFSKFFEYSLMDQISDVKISLYLLLLLILIGSLGLVADLNIWVFLAVSICQVVVVFIWSDYFRMDEYVNIKQVLLRT